MSGKVHSVEDSKVVETICLWITSLLTRVRLYSDYEDSVAQLKVFIMTHRDSLSDHVYKQIHQIFFVSMDPNCTSWARFSRCCLLMDLGHSMSSLCEGNNRCLKETTEKNGRLAAMKMDEAAKVAVAHSAHMLKEIEK